MSQQVEAWNLLVEEALSLVRTHGVGLYLPDAQSYPFIMAAETGELFRRDVDGEGHYSPREIIEGGIVIANTEIGYWTTPAARSYPNPLLVKLMRAVWTATSDASVVGECHWGRTGVLLRSGVIPHVTDVAAAVAATLGRFVDKNGAVSSAPLPPKTAPVAVLRELVEGEARGIVPPQAAPQFSTRHLAPGAPPPDAAALLESPGGSIPKGGAQRVWRSLSSARLPYPALLLGRTAWTAVDVLYTLPGVPMTFGEEQVGRAFRIDVTGTYAHNPAYLDEERAKRDKRIVAERHAARLRGSSNVGGSVAAPMTHRSPPAGDGGGGPQSLTSSSRWGGSYGNGLADAATAAAAAAHFSSTRGGGGAGGGDNGPSHLSSSPFVWPGAPQQQLQQQAHGPTANELYPAAVEGDVGVGGVVPAMPLRGVPAFKISRTGFSSVNLAALGGGDSMSASTLSQTTPRMTHRAGIPSYSFQQQAPSQMPISSLSSSSLGYGYRGNDAPVQPQRGMTGVTSSPALQALLQAAAAEQHGLGGSSMTPRGDSDAMVSTTDDSGNGPRGNGGGSRADTAFDEMDDGNDESDGGDDEEGSSAVVAGAAPLASARRPAHSGGGGGFGFYVTPLHGAARTTAGGSAAPRPSSKLRSSWGPTATSGADAAAGAGAGANRMQSTARGGENGSGGSTQQHATPPPMRAGGRGNEASSDITRVTSWRAVDRMAVMGGGAQTADGSDAAARRDAVKAMPALEARLRADVGPQYGFDLAQIAGHYEHRRALRARFGVLRDGGLTVLRARHRFGEHGHVFSFARSLPGQVAVVAANFNGHPSTFAVDCAPLTAAFSASSTADASASVAQLMTAGTRVGDALAATAARLRTAANVSPAEAANRLAAAAGAVAGASLSLRGGLVWEVRDIFASPSSAAAIATSGTFNGATAFSAADGPLIGVMTSEEAAYAPMLRTLPPHRSYCWLYVASSSAAAAPSQSADAGKVAADSGASQPLSITVPLRRESEPETDAAAMQWLFASSLLRLQSVLRLKECGLTTAVVTHAEVASAGSAAAVVAARRRGAGEPWISPGEALKDDEITAAVRHNLVYSLVRVIAKKAFRGLSAAAMTPQSTQGSTAQLPFASPALVRDVAKLVDAALRVLVTHWQLRVAPASASSGVSSGTAPTPPLSLAAGQLPPLPGSAQRRAGGTGAASSQADVNGGDPSWYCIDGDAAATVTRAALFLAVKDVVKDVSGGGVSAADSAMVSDTDAAVSALVLSALKYVAHGRSAAGVAIAAAGGGGADNGSSLSDAVLRREAAVVALARRLLASNSASPVVFVTPELGKWSTVGGLGVMVDELSVGLAELGADVIAISPYYNVNRKGVSNYLQADGITYSNRNVSVWVGGERIEMGVHEGRVKGVRLFFLHNADVFPRPYPPHDAYFQTKVMAAFAKGCLEVLCQWHLIPSLIVTNDWFTGLVPAYARHGHFGDAFNRTDFMHIAHNLDPDYEGRLWPTPAQGTLAGVHGLPSHLLVDHQWHDTVLNPTRAALLCSDTWATVSRSYRADLLSSSPQRSLLRLAPHPFAHPNGIPVVARLERLSALPTPTHAEAKTALQRKYFGFEHGDPSLPLFAFVGRITLQKGVHLILQAVDRLLSETGGRAMFLVGGMASSSDTYGANCAHAMRDLASRHRGRFWANPDAFFVDGDLVNIGADFCVMPSMFEPGGIVQQEFFVAGTPVIAFRTGGLKDTVSEFDQRPGGGGNGFLFEAHTVPDFEGAVRRALSVFQDGEAYARLRANARASVMDLAVVSLAWYREFHRIRRCLPRLDGGHHGGAGTAPPTRFALRIGEIPLLSRNSAVRVSGSWCGWSEGVPLALNAEAGIFEAALALPPGTHQFKFIVDGKWLAAPGQDCIRDSSGNENNVVSVELGSALEDDEEDTIVGGETPEAKGPPAPA